MALLMVLIALVALVAVQFAGESNSELVERNRRRVHKQPVIVRIELSKNPPSSDGGFFAFGPRNRVGRTPGQEPSTSNT